MLYMTMEENIDTQSEAMIGGLMPDSEYCVAIQVSTIAGESGYSNALQIHCEIATYSFKKKIHAAIFYSAIKCVHPNSLEVDGKPSVRLLCCK